MYVRCPRCRGLINLDRNRRCFGCGESVEEASRLPPRGVRVPLAEQDVLFDTSTSRAVMFVVATGVIAGIAPLIFGVDAYAQVFGAVLFALVAVSLVAWLGSRYAPGRSEEKVPGCRSAFYAVGMVVLGFVSLVAGLLISLFLGCADDFHG